MQDVSVIMPALNAQDTIARSASSVLAEPEVLELIVVNDGSTDDTAGVLAAMGDDRIVVVKGGGLGVAGGINAALEVARGRYIARCDADDIWVGTRLAWQRALLESTSDHVAVSAAFATVTERGRHVADLAVTEAEEDTTEALLSGRSITTLCTFLIRTEALRQIGGARREMGTAEDLDIQYRLAALGRIRHVPKVVYHYTLHDGSVTHQASDARRLFYSDAATRFAQQRLSGEADDLARGLPLVFDPETEVLGESTKRSARAHVANHLTGEAWRRFEAGDKAGGLKRLLRALAHAPGRRATWRSLGAMLLRVPRD